MNNSNDPQAGRSPALQDLREHQDFIPYTVLVLGVVMAFVVMFIFKPEAIPEDEAPALVQVVDWVKAAPETRSITVHSQGTVKPRIAIDLVAQVAGRVESVNDNFAEGAFFTSEEVLIQIESHDYEYALIRAESRVADAAQVLATEKGRAKQAKREWRDLGDKESNDLFLRKPQLASAEFTLKAAKADRDKAKLDLERTGIHAPFEGRVWKKMVDVGQYVTPGTSVARVYATDKVEIRLPLTNSQVGLVDLPVSQQHINRENGIKPKQPEVTFSAEFGRRNHQWQGTVVRTEASIDTESRVVFAVAEVDNPFANNSEGVVNIAEGDSPMAIGLFVEAEITGHEFENVMTLPRDALLQTNQIYTVDENSMLHAVDVEVLKADAEQAVVQVDIPEGTVVVTSYVSFATEGLKVKLREPPAEELAEAE